MAEVWHTVKEKKRVLSKEMTSESRPEWQVIGRSGAEHSQAKGTQMHGPWLGTKLGVSRKEETHGIGGRCWWQWCWVRAGRGGQGGRWESGKCLEEVGRGILTFLVFYKTCLNFLNWWTFLPREYVCAKCSRISKGKNYTSKEGRKLRQRKLYLP